MSGLGVAVALLLDQLLGEPRRWHPLIGFGYCANWVESHLNHHQRTVGSMLKGFIATVILIVPTCAAVWLLRNKMGNWHIVIDIVVLYWAIGLKSMVVHVTLIVEHLFKSDSEGARSLLAQIVSRDTESLSDTQVAAATIETVLENGNDAVFAPIFWAMIGGAPLVILYRLANTLDAMWGYRTRRFEAFGKAAARLDDALNFVPARLTALAYALMGSSRRAFSSWRVSASLLDSPNAGPVMASGAGALNLQLGGAGTYRGELKAKPVFGGKHIPTSMDINRAVILLHRTTFLWVLSALIIALLTMAWQ